MVLRSAFSVATCLLWLAGGSAFAQDYRPGEYLKLDLSKAVLSPKRLGPPAEFEQVPVEARTDTKQVVAAPKAVAPKARVAQSRSEKPRAVKQARRGNPLDANAMDTRGKRSARSSVQAWPCKSGGICNWKR